MHVRNEDDALIAPLSQFIQVLHRLPGMDDRLLGLPFKRFQVLALIIG